MNAERLPLNDDHGDRFPGALPAPRTGLPRHEATHERLVRMRAAYLNKINAAVEADREDLADELATSFAHEASGVRTPQPRTRPGSPARRRTAAGGTVRAMIRRFDRHTLEVFNAGTPSRPLD